MKRLFPIEVPRWRGVLDHMVIALTLLLLEGLLAVTVARLL